MPNHPGELFVLLRTAGLSNLTYDQFVNKYCTGYHTPYGFKITGAKKETIPELKVLLSKIMLRRNKEQVMKELPPISYGHIAVEASPVDIKILPSFAHYLMPEERLGDLDNDLKKQEDQLDLLMDTLGTRNAFGGKDLMRGLEAFFKSTSTLRRYVGCQKVQAVADLVKQELTDNAYDKIVIFALHRDVIEGLRERLSKFKAVTLYGRTSPETREKNIKKFQTNPKCRVFIGNILAAGTAITLTAANQVLFIEADWVPGNNAQAAMRCHRIGQTRPVFVRFAGITGSLDDKIMQVLKNKTRDATEIVG